MRRWSPGKLSEKVLALIGQPWTRPRLTKASSHKLNISNLQKFRIAGEVAVAVFCDHNDVLQAHPAHAGVVEPGLDRDHVASSQGGLHMRDARWLVDIEAQSVSRAVEESLHPAIDLACRKAPLIEEGEDFLVNDSPADPLSNQPEGQLLSRQHHRIGFF